MGLGLYHHRPVFEPLPPFRAQARKEHTVNSNMSSTVTTPQDVETAQTVVPEATNNRNTNHLPPVETDTAFQGLRRANRANTLQKQSEGVPKFSDLDLQRKWMKEHMAAAFRWFGKLGYSEGVAGHMSMRGMYV